MWSLDQSGCAAKVGADGAPPSIVFSKGAAAPLSETAPVNPVLLSKNSFRSFSWLFVRLVVQKNKKLELAWHWGFLFTSERFALFLMFLKNQTKVKRLSIDKNPHTRCG